jgi:hypothetical protein
MKSRSDILLEKSIYAYLSALEIYNKPNFYYREEVFCILLINAWELLFKARILKINNNKISSLYIKEIKKDKNGVETKKQFYKKNKTNNFYTLSMNECIKKLNNELDKMIILNIDFFIKMRDNAIHYYNEQTYTQNIFELAVANLKNYQKLMEIWFNNNSLLNNLKFFITPLTFDYPKNIQIQKIKNSKEFNNVLEYISNQSKNVEQSNSFYLTAIINTKIIKTDNPDFTMKRDIEGISFNLTDEELLETFPLKYKDLYNKCKNEKINQRDINKYKKEFQNLQNRQDYCYCRKLDPKSSYRGNEKWFYNDKAVNYIKMKANKKD